MLILFLLAVSCVPGAYVAQEGASLLDSLSSYTVQKVHTLHEALLSPSYRSWSEHDLSAYPPLPLTAELRLQLLGRDLEVGLVDLGVGLVEVPPRVA